MPSLPSRAPDRQPSDDQSQCTNDHREIWRNPNSVASPIPITSAIAEINSRTAPATVTTRPNILRDKVVSFSPSI